MFLAGLAVLAGVGIGVIARRRARHADAPCRRALRPGGAVRPGGWRPRRIRVAADDRSIDGGVARPTDRRIAAAQSAARVGVTTGGVTTGVTGAGVAAVRSLRSSWCRRLAPPTTVPAASGGDPRLARARDLLRRSRWAEALAVARAILDAAPTNAEASALAQQAESEIVIEECLRNARSALREGDRERALEEVRRGFLVRKNDPRLLEMHREVVQQ